MTGVVNKNIQIARELFSKLEEKVPVNHSLEIDAMAAEIRQRLVVQYKEQP